MKILVIADVHGISDKISNYFNKLKTENINLIVCPGDFTNMFLIPQGFTQEDIAELVLQKLISLGKPLLCIPGNHDPYELVDVFDEYGVNIHNKTKKIGKFNLMGFGGAKTPFMTKFEPTEEEIERSLEKFSKTKNLILVVHNPPKNTKLDEVSEGKHVGSVSIRKFIEKTQPHLVLSAHIHEQKGTDKIGKSVIFYPGPFYEGFYGVVDLSGKEPKCEIKQIK